MVETEEKAAETEVDKEDVIETQNEKETDKEDVIEDEVKDDQREDYAVLDRLDKLFGAISDIRTEINSVKDSVALFAENGAVIRENDYIDIDNDGDDDFVPIEELDLNI